MDTDKTWMINPKTGKNAFCDNAEYPLATQATCRVKMIDHIQVTSTMEVREPEKLLNITRLQKRPLNSTAIHLRKSLRLPKPSMKNINAFPIRERSAG
jgi:hypothetical protein